MISPNHGPKPNNPLKNSSFPKQSGLDNSRETPDMFSLITKTQRRFHWPVVSTSGNEEVGKKKSHNTAIWICKMQHLTPANIPVTVLQCFCFLNFFANNTFFI